MLAAKLSTISTRRMPTTRPLLSTSPACSPMAVAVPRVSKKSTISTANSDGTRCQRSAPRTSAWKALAKLGAAHGRHPGGSVVTRSGNATAVATAMPIRIAPGTRCRISTAMTIKPTTATRAVRPSAPANVPWVTGVPWPATTNLPPTKPRKAMNRPMPAPVASRRSRGIASMTASRSPASTSASISTPSSTITPMAACQLPACLASVKATNALSPMPGAVASGNRP